MTKEEVEKIMNDNKDLLGNPVIHDKQQFIFKSFEPNKFSDGSYTLNVLLEKGTIGSTVPFDKRENFPFA